VLDLGRTLERDRVEEDDRCADLAIGLARDPLLLHHVEEVLADLLLAHVGGGAHVVLGEEPCVEKVDFPG